ncbi:hypothetical protein MATR_24170 [Marivirga tractuosa]|uniref:Uncharacterized protein n=1 Tax=Marivirga tractuosa (strain ATCC 23168 / DSM 4126 / NBRC 15989 / NCIMB 1408 / VKM B-1430 / H-43) TaxID=643867 RepID=E4TR75_MARTH|nr:hypothetical protein [Marivirga tractuosa]ADR23727.1 hypothetical protein Ftrac_3760 [Marivirga tractuosa DSM 4126]BDD15592.1 hypothetical protein MATR_24170 [Marivirga tractuosa]
MRRIFIILFLFILILASGYGIYYYWDKQKSLDAWSLVPENTFLVYENKNLVGAWNSIQENPIWKDLQNIEYFSSLKNNFEALDSLSGNSGMLDEVFRNNHLLIGMSVIANDDFDFVFYQTLKNTEQIEVIKKIESKFDEFEKSERVYNKNTIYELKSEKSEKTFSYVLLRGNFVGSFSPVLVEDVIRNLEKDEDNFKESIEEVFKIANFQDDLGNLYINFNRLDKIVKTFTKSNQSILFNILAQFSEGAFLDLFLDGDDLYLNGFTFPHDSISYLNTYTNQEGGDITLENYLPSKTAVVLHERFSDAKAFQDEKFKFWNKIDAKFGQKRNLLAEQYDTDFRGFHEFMAGENAQAILNSNQNLEENNKLIFIKMNDKNEGLNKFNRLAEEAAQLNQDTLYYEFYAENEIRELVIEEFPYYLLGKNFKGFSHTFFTSIDNVMIISNDIQSLKELILDMETENTWGKSIKENQFLESTLQESNLNVFINLPQAWSLLLNSLNDKWRKNFRENEFPIKNFDMLAIQFSHENDRYYSNVELTHSDNKVNNEMKHFDEVMQVELDAPIISKPYVVKNHNTGLFETLVQDSALNLHLISTNGDVIWTEPLGAPIIGDVFQIDYYQNNKLQYAFATTEKVFLLDRNGIALEYFPKSYGEPNIENQYFNVIDYDKSRTYRLLIAKENGDIYLTSKYGDMLGDWNPLKMKDKIAAKPEHIRIRSKDFMVVLQENGLVKVMSRNGEMKPNFPVNINDRLSNNLFFEIGNSFESSHLVTITNGGALAKISFTGKIKEKEQLYMPNKETLFKIVKNTSNRSYILARQDLSRVSLLQPSGEMMFEKDYINQEEMEIQYYELAPNKEIIAVTDKKQAFTYLYTSEGQLINQQPIESIDEIALIYYNKDNEVHVYKCHGNKFSILKFKI